MSVTDLATSLRDERAAPGGTPGSRARPYVLAWLGLVALTALTLVLSRLPLGGLHVPVALAIAGAKAGLVLVSFMHVRQQRTVAPLILGVGVLFVVTLVALMALDVESREWPEEPGAPRGAPPPARSARGS